MARNGAVTAGIKLDGRTRARLKTLGRIKNRSPHWLMKEAICRYLDREEAAEKIKRETLERWERYEASGEHIGAAAIAAWLETWGTKQEGKCPGAGA